MIMEGKCSITSRCRPHDQQIHAEGRTATAKVKDSEPVISSRRSECKQGVSQPTTSCQSLGIRPPLPPRPIKHIEFSKSPVTVCSSSANHASLPCSSTQSHSPSTKSLILTPALSTNSLSLVTKSSKERLQKPQTPPKPHFLTPEFTQEKRINNKQCHGKLSTSIRPLLMTLFLCFCSCWADKQDAGGLVLIVIMSLFPYLLIMAPPTCCRLQSMSKGMSLLKCCCKAAPHPPPPP